jgi:hypothetical protein
MKNFFTIALIAVASLGSTACSFITSYQPGATNVTGEAWYVRRGLFSSQVFYCDGKGTCKEASVN